MGEFKDPSMDMPAPKQEAPAPEQTGEVSDMAKPNFDAEAEKRIREAVRLSIEKQSRGLPDGLEGEGWGLSEQIKFESLMNGLSGAEQDEVYRRLDEFDKAQNEREKGQLGEKQ